MTMNENYSRNLRSAIDDTPVDYEGDGSAYLGIIIGLAFTFVTAVMIAVTVYGLFHLADVVGQIIAAVS